MSIATLQSFLFQSLVVFRDGYQQLHLLGIKKGRLHKVTIAVELADLFFG
jgi:hypothetical protein